MRNNEKLSINLHLFANAKIFYKTEILFCYTGSNTYSPDIVEC